MCRCFSPSTVLKPLAKAAQVGTVTNCDDCQESSRVKVLSGFGEGLQRVKGQEPKFSVCELWFDLVRYGSSSRRLEALKPGTHGDTLPPNYGYHRIIGHVWISPGAGLLWSDVGGSAELEMESTLTRIDGIFWTTAWFAWLVPRWNFQPMGCFFPHREYQIPRMLQCRFVNLRRTSQTMNPNEPHAMECAIDDGRIRIETLNPPNWKTSDVGERQHKNYA